MADNMMLPIRFDLDGAVTEAAEDWKKKYASRLEAELRKRKVKVGVELNISNLDTIQNRLNNIKIKPISTENQAAIRKMAADLNVLAKALENVQKYSARSVGSSAVNNAKIAEIDSKRIANLELARQRAARAALAEDKLAQARIKAALAANQAANATTKANAEFSKQDSYISRVIKRLAIYASFNQIGNFLSQVREVTAQFELQRVSLGAILQDQQKANQLFGEIKSFALKSPVTILDLTKYTKQLAAYKIGYEELFETTKRLTDVSVGLGVSMDRIVLLYGQIRATGYLRACLGKDTPIVMYDGSTKAVQDVEVGDLLMGDDETPRKVSVLHHGVQQMYRVKYADGEFRCNEHHKLTLYNIVTREIEDVYVFAVYGWPKHYKGVKRINGKYEYFDFELIKDTEDSYFGFTIDGNKRFVICENIVTHNSEVRQATEAGIPLVDELAKKLTAANGELVRAADVMDMISKREIPFQMVKEVFEDMTSAGGIFYNMQEKQGQTLFGMWAKLGDAASMMYDQIGNTDSINEAMKDTIQLLTDLMRNWREVGRTIGAVGVSFAAAKMIAKIQGAVAAQNSAIIAANAKYMAASVAYREALHAEISAKATATAEEYRAIVARTTAARATLDIARAEYIAARNATIFSKAWKGVTSFLSANWIGMVITGLALIGTWIYNAAEKATRLNRELSKIDSEGLTQTSQSVRQFEYLAEAALKAADGTKEQRDKLSELQRTFGEIIPVEKLSIENLRKLRDGAKSASEAYSSLTTAIREYVAEQTRQRKVSAVESEYGTKIQEAYNSIRRNLKEDLSISLENRQYDYLSEEEIERFFEAFNKEAVKSNKELTDKVRDAFLNAGIKVSVAAPQAVVRRTDIDKLNDALREQEERIVAINNAAMASTGELGEYARAWLAVQKQVNSLTITGAKEGTFLFDRKSINETIKAYKNFLKSVLEENGNWKDSFAQIEENIGKEGEKMSKILWKAVLENSKNFTPAQQNTVKAIQNAYNKLVPTDATVQIVREKFVELANAMGEGLIDKVKGKMMGAEETLEEYRKKIKDTVTDLGKTIKSLNTALALTSLQDWDRYEELTKDLANAEEKKKFYDALLALLPEYETSNNRASADPRLNILQEMVSTLKTINQEYEELAKKEGDTQALSDIQRTYTETLANLNSLTEDYNFSLPEFKIPKTAEELQNYLKAIREEMVGLKKSDKNVLALTVDIEKDTTNRLQKKIEEQIKELAERVSNTKIAKDFYNKILAQSGDIDIAKRITFSIYGDDSYNLHRAIADQIRETFKTGNENIDAQIGIKLDSIIDTKNERVNYMELAMLYEEYQDKIIEKNRDTAKKIVAEGQKTMAENILSWEKELAKAKTYEEQRTDIIRREAQRRAEIYKSEIPQEDKDRLIEQSRRKEQEDLAKVNFEEFTKSDDYIRIFENLDYISSKTLKRLRERIQDVIKTNKDLSPENMKTLVKAMNDVENEINDRGFGNVMVSSVKTYINATRSLRAAKQELAQAKADYEANEGQYDIEIAAAKKEEKDAQEELNKLKSSSFATTTQLLSAQLRLNTAQENAKLAEEKKAKAAKKVEEAERKVEASQDSQTKSTKLMWSDFEKVGSEAKQLSSELSEVKDLLGISEDSAAGITFDSAISSLETVNKAIEITTAAQALWNMVAESNPYLAIATTVLAIGMALGNFFRGNKIAKANREIERQQELLDNLEYTYERLANAQDKLFGVDSVRNYNQQLKNLQAQQSAYLKQAEEERSKGKDADKDKIKEYEQAARDAVDEIKDLQGQLMETFAGSSITDVAKTWAESFIDAKLSMEDTYAAMKEDYADLVKSFIVQGAAARIAESALSPLWESVDKMLKNNNIDGAIDALVNGMDVAISTANSGLEGLWQALEKKGYDLRDVLNSDASDYTGIAKNVATATSEEINANTAALNTQNFYMATINENVAMIAQKLLVGGGVSTSVSKSEAGWTDWQRQAMDSYLAIQRNTADAVVECRRTANACEATLNKINRIIVAKGNVSGINVFTK